jgi:hypothetical protein
VRNAALAAALLAALLAATSSPASAQPLEVLPTGQEVAPRQAATPPIQIKLRTKVETTDRFGFRAGFAIASISGGIQLAALSFYPFAGAAYLFDQGGMGGAMLGLLAGALGLTTVGLGVAETVIASVMLPRYRNNRSDEELPDRAWSAGMMRGLAWGYLLHGGVNLAIAVPLAAVSDASLGGWRAELRMASWIGLGVGGAQALAGVILLITGHVKLGRVMGQVALTPTIGPQQRGLALVGRF